MKKNKTKKIKKKKAELCTICERPMGDSYFGCEKCGNVVCEGCFDSDSDLCIDCKV